MSPALSRAVRVTGFKPRRTIPRANFSGGISGNSDKSISSSGNASTRRQLVRDFFEVVARFILRCLPDGNNANQLVRLGVSNGHDAPVAQAKSDKPRFAIIVTIIKHGDGLAREHRCAVHKVNPMITDVRLSLRLVPVELHARECNYAKQARLCCKSRCR